MKFFYQYTSIRTKLILAILLSCFVLLVIGGGSFLLVEFYSSRIALQQEVRTLASSLATNSSRHLVLGKYSEIEKTLSSLKQQHNIHAAYLFDAAGEPVAEYLNQHDPSLVLFSLKKDFNSGDAVFILPTEEQQIFDWKHLGSFVPVFFDNKIVGSIYLLSDLNQLYTRLSILACGFIVAFLFLFFSSWLLARWIQGPILAPLLRLADVMNQVSTSNNYSLRAEKLSADEVGILVDGFNQVLDQIEQQQDKLIRHQDELEKTVAERTAALRMTVGQLDQARKMADSANAAKSDFLSKMTHELRTPLIGVLGMNELLQRSILDEQQQMLTETVRKSGEELLDMISDVLDISRIEAGQLKLEPRPVRLYQVVEDVIRLLTPMATEKGIDIRADIDLAATWTVSADENRIRQILINLVGNAVKFTLSGHITVGLDCKIENRQQGLFTLSVLDTGIGMDDEVRSRIFDLFYQSDSSGTRTEHGAGLGLAIVRQLVELMNGELRLTSIPDQGSCFEIQLSLPLIVESSLSIPESLRGEEVLLSVNDSSLRDILIKRLFDLGCQVDMAVNADDFWFYLRTAKKRGKPYALLFIDEVVHTVTGQPLYLAMREAASMHMPRIILLNNDHGHQVPLMKNETRLKLPLCWLSLCRVMTLSWRGLHLVPSLADDSVCGQKKSLGQAMFLLLGQQLASCELLRLQLMKKGVVVDLVGDLDSLPLTRTDDRCRNLLIDCPYTPEEELVDFFEKCQQRFASVILLSDVALERKLNPFGFNQLIKPLRGSDIDTLLKPLLSELSKSQADNA